MRHPKERNTDALERGLPKGFWQLMFAAVVVGNLAMLYLLWSGAPPWFAVPAPTLAVGIAGVIVEYRRRRTREDAD